jgi:DNA-binding PadR family transcriptional regulator
LRSADLQLLIVALLAERPRHGYELIKDIEEQSRSYYVPSPGMIYPALSYLEEAGHALAQADGAKKRYSLTPEGQAWLAEHRAAADALIAQLAQMGERTERARQAWAGDAATGDAEHGGFFGLFSARRKLTAEMHEAYHAIKDAMRAKLGANAAEQRRVAAILQRAAAEILNADDKDRA